MTVPSHLKYSKDHEWIQDLNNGTAKIGVTGFAVEQLGDIVHLDLPAVGSTFKAEAAFGTIESTKTVSDLYMPVEGKVVEVNTALQKNLEGLQADPYDKGWLIKVEITDKTSAGKLMSSNDYETYLNEDH